MMQETIVALVVAYAVAVVLRRYAPKAARSWMARNATKFGWHALAGKIVKPADDGASCANGCGSCSSCGPDSAKSVEEKSTISVESLKRTISR